MKWQKGIEVNCPKSGMKATIGFQDQVNTLFTKSQLNFANHILRELAKF